MTIAYFISSTGDTDLALPTITELKKKNPAEKIFLVVASTPAVKQTTSIRDDNTVTRILLAELINHANTTLPLTLTQQDIEKVTAFLARENIRHVFFGVASEENEIPFQIALQTTIAHTIVYEFMFKPPTHTLWKYAARLTANKVCRFAVTLKPTADDIRQFNPAIEIHEIGHLSIDRALIDKTNVDHDDIRNKLQIKSHEELVFIAGSTQAPAMDNALVAAVLEELATGKYPNLQLRFGMHPGTQNSDDYLQMILTTCKNFPKTKTQFKIIMPKDGSLKPAQAVAEFLLPVEVNGAGIAQTATRLAQAVPGALLNEAALRGKPVYIYDQSIKTYLPADWFAKDLATFFNQKRVPARTRKNLGLKNTSAPIALATLTLS